MKHETVPSLHQVERASDLDELLAYLGGVSGPVGAVHRSYGDVPELEIPAGVDRTWTISPEASAWTLLDPDGHLLASSDSEDAAGALLTQMRGAGVDHVSVLVPDLDLTVSMSDGRRWVIEAKASDEPAFEQPDESLPAWEVTTPHGVVLAAGPGNRWVQYSAHLPESKLPWSSSSEEWARRTREESPRAPRPQRFFAPVARGAAALAIAVLAVLAVNVLDLTSVTPDDLAPAVTVGIISLLCVSLLSRSRL